MRKATLAAGALALCGIVFSALPAMSSIVPSANRPKILLHVRSVPTKNQCTTSFTPVTCSDIVTHVPAGAPGAGIFYYIYLVVAKGDSMTDLAGMQCGIAYQGYAPETYPGSNHPESDGVATDVYAWALCARLEFQFTTNALWTQPGGSNLITWDSSTTDPITGCQTGALARAGYWYVGSYGDDIFKVTVRPVDHLAKVASCSASEAVVHTWELGYIQFGASEGCNPCLAYCDVIPVKPTTWSDIKTLYHH
jgi:hypothetical protein